MLTSHDHHKKIFSLMPSPPLHYISCLWVENASDYNKSRIMFVIYVGHHLTVNSISEMTHYFTKSPEADPIN